MFHNAEMNVPRMCRVASENDVVAFVVDYRKAPECKAPGSIEDCVAVIEEVWNNAEKYGVDREKIVLAGRSAGSYVAVGAAMKLVMEGKAHKIKM